jgi:hypothetical protein
VASPLSGAAVVEVDIGAGVVLLGRIGKEIVSMELVGVGGDDELGGKDGRPGGDEAGIAIELVSEVVEKVEELAIVLEGKGIDGDGELRLNCVEEGIGEGEVLKLSDKVRADGIEIGGKNELDWVSELEVWAELDDIPELDNSIELDTATMLDETAEPDKRTELENAPRLENGAALDCGAVLDCGAALDWGTELDVGNGLVDNAELDTGTELVGKAELEAGTVLEYNAELVATIKLEV